MTTLEPSRIGLFNIDIKKIRNCFSNFKLFGANIPFICP